MNTRSKLLVLSLSAALVVAGLSVDASAYCSSCGAAPATYSVGYAAPVYTTAYAPAYTAAYAPAYTAAYAPAYTAAYAPAYTTYYNGGWYPGKWLGRANRAVWGYPTTTYYAPTYTAGYASTAYYAPSYSYASYAPTCSTCSASYAPACSSCSSCGTCGVSYAPACSSCNTCSACSASYAPACSTCSTCDTCGTVSAPACSTCAAVSPAAFQTTTTVPPPAQSASPTGEPAPTIAPSANVPEQRQVNKPESDATPVPEPAGGATDDSALNFSAPQLLDATPNDKTAEHHPAPVWTAVLHKTPGAETAVQPISWQQVQRDAEGWTSVSE